MAAYAIVSNDFLSLAEASNDWRAVHARLEASARRRGELDAHDARDLREAERRRIWREVGEPNMLAYVERVLGYGPRSAYDRMRVARALGQLPFIEELLARGEIFY